MAVQAHGKKPGAQILRTPAPDEVTRIRSPKGGEGYGQNAPQASSIAPGKGGPQSLLGQNMRESVDDPVADEILAHGIAGRGDNIPADGDDDQLRNVSAEMYPPTHGAVRQQDPDFFKAKPPLPASTSDSDEEPVRKPS
jgi:hypothetical protein